MRRKGIIAAVVATVVVLGGVVGLTAFQSPSPDERATTFAEDIVSDAKAAVLGGDFAANERVKSAIDEFEDDTGCAVLGISYAVNLEDKLRSTGEEVMEGFRAEASDTYGIGMGITSLTSDEQSKLFVFYGIEADSFGILLAIDCAEGAVGISGNPATGG